MLIVNYLIKISNRNLIIKVIKKITRPYILVYHIKQCRNLSKLGI